MLWLRSCFVQSYCISSFFFSLLIFFFYVTCCIFFVLQDTSLCSFVHSWQTKVIAKEQQSPNNKANKERKHKEVRHVDIPSFVWSADTWAFRLLTFDESCMTTLSRGVGSSDRLTMLCGIPSALGSVTTAQSRRSLSCMVVVDSLFLCKNIIMISILLCVCVCFGRIFSCVQTVNLKWAYWHCKMNGY